MATHLSLSLSVSRFLPLSLSPYLFLFRSAKFPAAWVGPPLCRLPGSESRVRKVPGRIPECCAQDTVGIDTIGRSRPRRFPGNLQIRLITQHYLFAFYFRCPQSRNLNYYYVLFGSYAAVPSNPDFEFAISQIWKSAMFWKLRPAAPPRLRINAHAPIAHEKNTTRKQNGPGARDLVPGVELSAHGRVRGDRNNRHVFFLHS